MAHTVEIFDKDFNQLATIQAPYVYDLSYSNEINKADNASFKMLASDTKATATNLQLYNRVKIYRGGVGVFIGFIENISADLNEIQIECVGMLGLFEKRLYNSSVTSVNAGAACFNILSYTNGINDTGIIAGTNTLTYTVNDIQFSRSTILSAWKKIIDMAGGEMEIDINQQLNIAPRLGVDKSSSIIFQYISTQINTATIYNFDVEIQGKDMVNWVLGIRTGGSSTKSDATSISQFGLLETTQNFSQTNNGTDLDNETQNYLDLHKVEFYVPKINPNPDKISIDSYDVGDTVKVVLSKGFILVNQNYRIIKKTVKVSENETLEVDINLIPEGVNLLPSTFFEDIMEIDKRVSLLEGAIP